MPYFTTQQVAKKLGIGLTTLLRYIEERKVPAPESLRIGKRAVRGWTEEDIQRVREMLPKIANGRKTRYQKLREKQKAQAGVPVPHRKKSTTKK